MRRICLVVLCLLTILLPLALNNISFPFLPPEAREALSQFSPSMPNVSAIGNQPPRPVGGFIYPLPKTPKLLENSTHYIYDTLYGNYCFLKALPFVASYSDHIDREVMVKASAFFLFSKYVLLPRAFTVEKDSSLFSVNVTVQKLTTIVAYLRIDWIFYADKEPKIVVALSKTAQWQSESIGDFRIFWVLLSPYKYAKAKGYATKTVSSTTLESYGNHTGIAMADDSLVFLAKKYLKIDWSDFGACEDVKVGTFDLSSLSKKLSGSGVYVLFPKNIAQIDPYTVATSTTASALAWGGMTKSHWDGTSYYWQAYCDGANWVAEYSSDGQTWTNTPVTLVSSFTRPIAFAFVGTEIFTVRGTYASQYQSQTLGPWSISCTAYLYFKRGVISGTAINWDSQVQVASYTQSFSYSSSEWGRGGVYAEFRYYDITEGTDGYLTIVASANKYYYIEEALVDPETGNPILPWYVYEQGSTYHYIAYKSTTATGSSWAAGTTIETSTSTTSTTYWYTDTRPRLAPLASAVILCTENKGGALSYRKSSAWTTTIGTIDASIKNVGAWGSLTGKNVTTGRCGLAYVDSDDTIDVWWYDGSTTHSDLNVIAATVSSPTFCLNNATNGNWYLLVISGTSIVYKKYNSVTDVWDTSATTLESSLTSPVDLSSSRTVLNGKVLLCWQTGSASPYTVNFDMLSIGFSTINFSGFTVSASDGTYQSKWNITAKWPDDSPVSGGSFYVYNATAQRASATSDSNGLIQFTVGGTIGGSGSLTINGTKDGAIGSTSVSFSTTATGGAYASCPSTWYAGEPRSVSVSFTNAAQIDSTKIKLENVRICFRLMSGSTVLFQANSSTLFNVDANSLKTYSQSLTLTGVASTGNYVLRALVLQLGSEWTVATIDRTIYVQALGETGSYSMPPNLILPSLNPLALMQGESRSFTFTVQLSQVSVADFMASTPSGAPSSWISVMAPSRISVASPAELTVMVSVPSDAMPGSYTILIPISASASSGSTRQMAQFTLTVEAKPSSPTAPGMSLVNIFSDIPPLFIFMVIGAVAVTAAVLVATNEKKPKRHKYYHR